MESWRDLLSKLPSIRIAVAAGVLVKDSLSSVDLLLVGSMPPLKVKNLIKKIEALEGRELNYTILDYDEFYYRLSVRDKFITGILSGRHTVLIDKDNTLTAAEKEE